MLTTGNFGLKKPEGTDPVDIQDFNENADIIDTELKKRPTATGNAGDMTSTFTKAGTRTNLVSGEALKTSFGKIMKWLSDLKSAAFAAVANNDTTTADGYVADARIVKVHGDEIDTINGNYTKLSETVTSSNDAFTQRMDTLNTSLNNCLKSVSDGKKAVAGAITAQGTNTAANAEFSTMVKNIGTIAANKYNAGISAARKGNAGSGQVLTGYTFTNTGGSGLAGTMPNRGALNWTPGGSAVYSVPSGYYSGGTLNSSSAYSNGYNTGVTAADNRVNVNSTNYSTGYNTGYNAGYSAGAGSKPTIYTGSLNMYVEAGNTFPTISHPATNNFAIHAEVRGRLWIGIHSCTSTVATLHCSGQGMESGDVWVTWIAW